MTDEGTGGAGPVGPDGGDEAEAEDAARAKAEAAARARAARQAAEAEKPLWERDPKPPETTDAMSDPLVEALCDAHSGSVTSASTTAGDLTIEVERDRILDACGCLRRSHDYDLLVDICGVDHTEQSDPRFEVVYHLFNRDKSRRVRIKVKVPADEEVASVSGIWRGANWCEREIYDMFGIRFTDHPDMTRILLWEGFNGYPLRKDFPVEGIDTGSAIYPELYEREDGPIAGTGTGWKKPAADEPTASGNEEPDSS